MFPYKNDNWFISWIPLLSVWGKKRNNSFFNSIRQTRRPIIFIYIYIFQVLRLLVVCYNPFFNLKSICNTFLKSFPKKNLWNRLYSQNEAYGNAQYFLCLHQPAIWVNSEEYLGPPQVKCWLLISSIFYVMNLRHFSEMP